ncbi:MAG: glycosyltransferase family 1 protein [Chthoniobacteraceae bacterium]|nr:glycosyltransferase family 1 protein [Chthoniobacteraceae bacterium]
MKSAPFKVFLVGNSDEFQFSMKLFPEMLLRGLRERDVPAELLRPRTVFGKLAPWAGRLGKWLFYIDKFLLFPVVLSWRLRREKGGFVVHICDHSNGMYVPRVACWPHLVTCHDVMPIRSALGEVPQNPTSRTGRLFQRLILAGLRKAGCIACVSHATQEHLLRVARIPPGRCRVILNGLHYPYTPMPVPEARARVARLLGGEVPPFVLHVGGDAWYKNRGGLLAMYAALRRRARAQGAEPPRLVCAGPPLRRELIPFAAEDPAMQHDVVALQGASNEDLRALYSLAECLLFPSWDEGFGWPIVEAQACGCRVVTTGRAPMTEVGGAPAFYIDPADPDAAAVIVAEVLRQPRAEREARVAAGLANVSRFTFSGMMEEYLALYRKLAARSGEGGV